MARTRYISFQEGEGEGVRGKGGEGRREKGIFDIIQPENKTH